MVIFSKEELASGVQKNFSVESGYSQVVDQSNSVNWSMFKAKSVRLGVFLETGAHTNKPSIILKDGSISGDLIISRMSETYEDIAQINIFECDVSGKVKISGIKTEKIEISGFFEKVELVNVYAKEIHFSGEVGDLIIREIDDQSMNFEANGYAERVLVKNGLFNALEFTAFSSKSMILKRVEGARIILPQIKQEGIKKVSSMSL